MSDPSALIELPATDVDDARSIVAMRVVEFRVTTSANGVHGVTYTLDTGAVETYTCASLEHAAEIEAYVSACVRLAVDSVALLREIERLRARVEGIPTAESGSGES